MADINRCTVFGAMVVGKTRFSGPVVGPVFGFFGATGPVFGPYRPENWAVILFLFPLKSLRSRDGRGYIQFAAAIMDWYPSEAI